MHLSPCLIIDIRVLTSFTPFHLVSRSTEPPLVFSKLLSMEYQKEWLDSNKRRLKAEKIKQQVWYLCPISCAALSNVTFEQTDNYAAVSLELRLACSYSCFHFAGEETNSEAEAESALNEIKEVSRRYWRWTEAKVYNEKVKMSE